MLWPCLRWRRCTPSSSPGLSATSGPATASTLLSARLAAGGRALGGAEQLGQLAGGGGVFWRFVVAPASGKPREAHGQPGVVADLSPGGGVVRRQGQFGAEDFEHQAGLEPDIRFLARVDPGGLARA